MILPKRLKTSADLQLLRISGEINGEVLRELARASKQGVCLLALENLAHEIIDGHKYTSAAFYGYENEDGIPFPSYVTLSVNQTAIHGIPSGYTLRNGDILKIDCGIDYRGRITDAAFTVPIGRISPETKMLLKSTHKALKMGISAALDGNTTGDVIYATNSALRANKCGICHDYSGHGVGFGLHEYPLLGSPDRAGGGDSLENGLVLAIEPLGFLSKDESVKLVLQDPVNDPWALTGSDGSLAAHYEQTIFVDGENPIVLTPHPEEYLDF